MTSMVSPFVFLAVVIYWMEDFTALDFPSLRSGVDL